MQLIFGFIAGWAETPEIQGAAKSLAFDFKIENPIGR